ncbi:MULTISPECIES: hypothetical protein [unclassified Roseateles]|uniref:hypothetical protein n=1 Tax=unclassified Roseateles TaxID=2626991 RepID=UPI0006FBE8EC|nr:MULTISPECIES: hypothetical protein [unclassified Roseateles]KQW45737.1 hypothetical protein ASC81_12675 [Pelomonas sp. Root405]KRA72581.1 hypothetical protein ASD88_12675 [Pelomonas sp. Root662]
MTLPTSALIQALQAHPEDADRLMRAACAELRAQPVSPTPPDAAALRVGLVSIAETGLDGVLQRLLDDAPRGAVTDGIAALLRPAELAWDEAQEIDWAARHWEACRADGLLDEGLAADFGEYWRQLEWSAVRQHLVLLGRGHPEQRRLLAQIVKTASRYVAFGPLKRALEARFPEFFELGFSLR